MQMKIKPRGLLLPLTALGVVFGDIGTSPLYAIKEIVLHLGSSARSPENILGYISLVIWTLTIVITVKYLFFLLRADNEGEGGVFALFALLAKKRGRSVAAVSFLLLLAAGLLFGEGMITPAISVLSAIEGLAVFETAFQPYIVPITIATLTALFLVQKRGTAKIGKVFGPIIAIWFISIAAAGLLHVTKYPLILLAFNPIHAISFIFRHSLHELFLVLGAVILVITGGEALYADLGHFGKKPIRQSWFALVFPALLLNYLGQGAFLLGRQPIINHSIFYSMLPSGFLVPMIILATAATVVASQALISGAFSLATQGISLGLIPFVRVLHTHPRLEGQIYVPFVNYLLFFGCTLLVLFFQSSSQLASAYGLAVSAVMLTTTIGVFLVAIKKWHWRPWLAALLFIPLGFIDFVFLSANSMKFFSGGYIPVFIGGTVLAILLIWQWGKMITRRKYQEFPTISMRDLVNLKKEADYQLPKSFIVLTPVAPTTLDDKMPLLQQILLDRYSKVARHIVFVTVVFHHKPYFKDKRFEVIPFYEDAKKGSIYGMKINYGYMEKPNIEEEIIHFAQDHGNLIEPDYREWSVHVLKERFFLRSGIKMVNRLRMGVFQFMYRNCDSADQYFGMGRRTRLSIEIIPVKFR